MAPPRKALNILGLNDPASLLQQQQPHSSKQLYKKPNLSLLSKGLTSNETTIASSLSSLSNSSNLKLNQTTEFTKGNNNNNNNGSKRTIMDSSSIAFPRFFNKKKKENLI